MFPLCKRILLSGLALVAFSGFAETAAFTLSPNIVSNTYSGAITLQIMVYVYMRTFKPKRLARAA